MSEEDKQRPRPEAQKQSEPEQVVDPGQNDPGQVEADPEPSPTARPDPPEQVKESASRLRPETRPGTESTFQQPSTPSHAAPPPPKSGRGLAALALLLSLGALGASGYQYWQATQRPAFEMPEIPEAPDVAGEFKRQIRPVESTLQDLRSSVESLQGSVDELRRGYDASLSSLRRDLERTTASQDGVDRSLASIEDSTRRAVGGVERRLGNIEGSIATLSDTRSNVSEELALSETEYLLRAGDERLRLFNDPSGAQMALTMAQSQLQTVEDPSYATVRQTLASHIQSLNKVNLPDRVALSGELLGLARESVAWPVDARRSLQASGSNLLTPEESEQGWWPRFKGILSNVVVVHREKEVETALLTLEEERLLRENMRLQLQVAQLAAVRGEQPLYEASIDAVSGWLSDYYDAESDQVTGARDQLTRLRSINLNPRLPDISPALRELRNIRNSAAMAESAPPVSAASEQDPKP